MGKLGKILAVTNPFAWPVAAGVVCAVFVKGVWDGIKLFEKIL